jgi:hypothetical protein
VAAAAIVAERIEAGEPPPNANGCAMAVGFKSARSGGAGHEVIAGHGLPRRGRPNVLDWPIPPDDDGEQSWLNVEGLPVQLFYDLHRYMPETNLGRIGERLLIARWLTAGLTLSRLAADVEASLDS